MNITLLPSLSTVGIIFACLLLALPLRDFPQRLLKQPMNGSIEQSVCVTLHLVFNLLALVMLTLQMNLLPILFVQAFAASALIMARMGANIPFSEQSANCALKKFLTDQSLLFVVAIGVFFATGTFKITDVFEHPKFLFADLPLLLVALLVILYSMGKPESEVAVFSGPMLALVELAQCYRKAFLLLFAGLFFAHNLLWAVVAAVLIYLLVALSDRIPFGSAWRVKFAWSWGYVFFACGLNLTWVYLKYWL
jgi:ech hydrogenase subunit B